MTTTINLHGVVKVTLERPHHLLTCWTRVLTVEDDAGHRTEIVLFTNAPSEVKVED